MQQGGGIECSKGHQLENDRVIIILTINVDVMKSNTLTFKYKHYYLNFKIKNVLSNGV
jgi:hypothetical protein